MLYTNDELISVGEKVVVREGKRIHFIEIEKIRYIEACNYYALVHIEGKTIVIRQTLDTFEKLLSKHNFFRIHRSIIVNVNIFTCIERENKTLMIRTSIGKIFRISRYRQKEITNRILAYKVA